MTHRGSIFIELFKRKEYKALCELLGLSRKQTEAFLVLCDNFTKEFVYGGAAGGGKTWVGVTFFVIASYAYDDTKWFIGRKQVKDLEGSVSITINKVCKAYGFEIPKYNGQRNWFVFSNGSQIDYKECRYRPEDQMYERLGSIEYTGGWIEEGGEIPFDAFDTLRTRVGRHNNEKYNLISKIFITCNPKKNWLYKDYYQPFKNDNLKPYQKYIGALVYDNPYISKDYIENLERTKDRAKKERLLKGNWDYEDDVFSLIDSYNKITDIFTIKYANNGTKYIICDVARFGSDRAIIAVFDGFELCDYAVFDKSKTTEISAKIKEFQIKHKVPNSQTLVDSDGVGGGVVDEVGCIGFVNNSKAIINDTDESNHDVNYDNIKSQCAFKLAEMINASQIGISVNLPTVEAEMITEELSQLKRQDTDKLKIINKKEMKENIGRSPDWLDIFIMRMFFEIGDNTPMFEQSELNYFDIKEVSGMPHHVLGWIKSSSKGTHSIRMPIGKVYRDGMDFKIYITDVMYNNNNKEINDSLCISMLNENRVSEVGYEMSKHGKHGAINLQRSVNSKVRVINEVTNEYARIVEQAPQIRMYVHFRNDDGITEEYKNFMNDIVKYLQSGKSKGKVDAPDSLAGLMWLIRAKCNF